MLPKLDGVAPLVVDPPDAKSTTDTDTHPLNDVGDHKGSGNPIVPKILDFIVVFSASGKKFL